MRRGLRYIGVLLATVLLMGGCSSGDGEPEAAPEGSESPTVTESPSEPPPPEPVDPCSLLTADELEAAGLTPDTETSVHGLAPDPRTTACMVPDRKDGWSAFYGFSLEPNVSVPVAIDQVGTEKPVKLEVGDDARLVLYDAYDEKTWHAWASQDEYAVMVELFAKPRPAQVERLLGAMLERIDPAMFEFPVDLPESCPPPTSRPLVKLIGKVLTATGSDLDGEVRCDYAERGGRVVNLTTSGYKNAQKVKDAVRDLAQYYDEQTTPARGVTLMSSPGEGYAFSGGYVTKPPSYRGADLQQMTVIGNPYKPLKYDVQAYRALASWWATQS